MSAPIEYPKRQPVKRRLSVSIPSYLAKWARDEAKRNDATVSAVVEVALRRAAAEYDTPKGDEA